MAIPNITIPSIELKVINNDDGFALSSHSISHKRLLMEEYKKKNPNKGNTV